MGHTIRVILAVLFGIVLGFLLHNQPIPKDDTLYLWIDDLTGCHYLVSSTGLVPRFTATGRQICPASDMGQTDEQSVRPGL